MKSTPFTEMATAFRGQIVRLWALRYPGTQSEAAAALTEAAINLGYVTRNRPIPGAALLSWASNPTVVGSPDGVNIDAKHRLEARK